MNSNSRTLLSDILDMNFVSRILLSDSRHEFYFSNTFVRFSTEILILEYFCPKRRAIIISRIVAAILMRLISYSQNIYKPGKREHYSLFSLNPTMLCADSLGYQKIKMPNFACSLGCYEKKHIVDFLFVRPAVQRILISHSSGYPKKNADETRGRGL